MRMGKSMSSHTLYAALRRDTKPITVRVKGVKTVDYSGYKVKIYPELVEGAGTMCQIQTSKGIVLAGRRGLPSAYKYIDQRINSKKSVPFRPRRVEDENNNTPSGRRRFPIKHKL